jgi:type I restriction enzyme R subunit
MKKWYGYVSQIVRMFDADLHKEYVFVSYLLDLLPNEPTEMINLEGKLQLEYYKLQKTFEGPIELKEESGVYNPSSAIGAMSPEPKEPLDEIIEKINEQYKGAFTDSDRVLITALKSRLMEDTKLQSMAQTSDPQIFNESIFPNAFGNAAMESYMESQDTYTSLFEDKAKYDAIMHALGTVIYREMQEMK